jgi:hypothetical protein
MTCKYIVMSGHNPNHKGQDHCLIMSSDKGLENLGNFKTREDAERFKRVAEQCGLIHARAMIRLLR